MITHFGTYDLIELPTPQTYSPATGITQQRRFRMLKTSVPSFTATLAAQGYAWEVSPDEASPFAVVTTIASPELTTTWMLDGNDLEKTIWQFPVVRALFSRIPDLKNRAMMRHDIEAIVRGEYTADTRKTVTELKAVLAAISTDPVAPGLPSVEGKTDEIFDEIIKALVEGTEAFALATFVLRKTMVLPPLTNVSPGFDNCNKLFTLAALVRAEPLIPLNLSGQLNTLAGYWQKKTPQASQAADGRWTYTVEYWHADDFNRFLYELIE